MQANQFVKWAEVAEYKLLFIMTFMLYVYTGKVLKLPESKVCKTVQDNSVWLSLTFFVCHVSLFDFFGKQNLFNHPCMHMARNRSAGCLTAQGMWSNNVVKQLHKRPRKVLSEPSARDNNAVKYKIKAFDMKMLKPWIPKILQPQSLGFLKIYLTMKLLETKVTTSWWFRFGSSFWYL